MALAATTPDDIVKVADQTIAEISTKFEESLLRKGDRLVTVSSGKFNSRNSSDESNSHFPPISKPTPSEIRRWMAETQHTVDKVVTDWQQDLIDNSLAISSLLEELTKFISHLDEEASPCSFLTGKLRNNAGTYESTINIYLHVILITTNKIVRSIEERDKRKGMHNAERQKFLDILGQFTFVAEDALKFLHTHKKYLVPVYSRILSMRDDLYGFLRAVNTEPLGKIIPLLSTVSLDKVRVREDTKWMERIHKEHRSRQEECSSYFEIKVGSRDYSFLVDNSKVPAIEEHTTTEEKLELVGILLKQLGMCVGSSSRSCKERHEQLFELCSRLWKSFHVFSRVVELESRRLRLKPENCSESLKTSLCRLEVKFHQVERTLEEIPDHLRRIVGICDQCCRQLITGLGEEVHDMFEQWSSPVEDLSEEYFKSRRSFLHGCAPFLWRIIIKVFLSFNGNSSSGDVNSSSSADSKLREFWSQVRTELEQFQQELKAKELEAGYSVILTVPLSRLKEEQVYSVPSALTNDLVKYIRYNKIKSDTITNDVGRAAHSSNIHSPELLIDK